MFSLLLWMLCVPPHPLFLLLWNQELSWLQSLPDNTGTNLNLLLETLGQFRVESWVKAHTLPLLNALTIICPILCGAAGAQGIWSAGYHRECLWMQWDLRDKKFWGARAQTETNRKCRRSSASGCLEVGIKRVEGIKNEDISTDPLLNYLSIGCTKTHLLHQVAVKVKHCHY